MFSAIGLVVAWCIVVIELVVAIGDIDAQVPSSSCVEDGAVEVVGVHEAAVLVVVEHVAGIIVARFFDVRFGVS